MKVVAGLTVTWLPQWVLAQQTSFPGTKKDILTTAAGTNSSGALGVLQLAQLLIALGIVFAVVKYLIPKLAARAGRRLNTKFGSEIKIEESATFAGGMLYIVTVRGRSLLISVGAQGVACLADVSEPLKPEDSAPTFKEMVDARTEAEDASNQPQKDAEEDQTTQANTADEALKALRRLAK